MHTMIFLYKNVSLFLPHFLIIDPTSLFCVEAMSSIEMSFQNHFCRLGLHWHCTFLQHGSLFIRTGYSFYLIVKCLPLNSLKMSEWVPSLSCDLSASSLSTWYSVHLVWLDLVPLTCLVQKHFWLSLKSFQYRLRQSKKNFFFLWFSTIVFLALSTLFTSGSPNDLTTSIDKL